MVTLFLCGDVMTGRGVDQVMRHPSDPRLHEGWVHDAREYVELAEAVSGRIPRPIPPTWIWGDALEELDRASPDARAINLETSVTRSNDFWTGKGINYRMNPAHLDCLSAARIDVCVLGNNHVLDFGYSGLVETIESLHAAGLKTAGAGRTLEEARRPAVLGLPGGGRLILFSIGTESSGVFPSWAATQARPGVDFLMDLTEEAAAALVERVRAVKQAGDLAVVSIHWGSNWGYEVPAEQVRFAHRLIDGGVDLVHGHSSHHPRPIEVYRKRLVLYGCGDFINDYEGIRGYEEFRGDLALMYLPTLEPGTGEVEQLRMVPLQIRQMRLHRASFADARWLHQVLEQVSRPFGTALELEADQALRLKSRARRPSSDPPGPGRPARTRP